MIITAKGTIIRMECRDISVLGRNTQGVRLVRVSGEDRVQAVSMLEDPEEDEPERAGAAPTETAVDPSEEEEASATAEEPLDASAEAPGPEDS